MSMKYCLGRSVHAVRSIFMPAMVRAAAAPLESKVKGHQYYKHNAKVSTVYIYNYILYKWKFSRDEFRWYRLNIKS